MMKKNQIARSANIASSTLYNIEAGRRRPSWKVAKQLAQATCTNPELWLEGSPSEIKAALEAAKTDACVSE